MYKKFLEHLKKADPVLYSYAIQIELPDNNDDVDDLFVHLCESIVSQQLSEKAGDTIFKRFQKLFPDNLITPEETIRLPDDLIRAAGLSYSKISYIKDLSQKVINGEVELDKFREMSEEKVIEELTKVKGIGPWTAEMFLMFALKREDVFSIGDLALRNTIQKMYGFENKPTTKELLEISNKWSPYRTYASRVLWRSFTLLK